VWCLPPGNNGTQLRLSFDAQRTAGARLAPTTLRGSSVNRAETQRRLRCLKTQKGSSVPQSLLAAISRSPAALLTALKMEVSFWVARCCWREPNPHQGHVGRLTAGDHDGRVDAFGAFARDVLSRAGRLATSGEHDVLQ